MSIRKPLILLVTMATLIGAIAAVFAYPWQGMSYIEKWRENRSGKVFYCGPRMGKRIAITFDDGPDSRYTGRVLDILRKRRIKATFFVCGSMLRQNPALGRRIVAEGHVIGNHTDSHPHLELEHNPLARREIDGCAKEIQRVTGVHTTLFRPPRGLWNADTFQDARRAGYSIVLWSLAFDRQAVKDSHILRDRVLRLAKPGDILLMHDGSTDPSADIRQPTLRELDAILTGLEQKGFSFVTVPDLLHVHGSIAPQGVAL